MTQDSVSLVRAIVANCDRLFARQDARTIQRRAEGWTDDGFSSGGDTAGRSASGAGEHSDPTFARAAAETTFDYRAALNGAVGPLQILERALADLTRPQTAALEERETAHTAAPAQSMSGTCEACGRRCSGDRVATNDIIVRSSGAALCSTHHRAWRRQHLPVAEFMAKNYQWMSSEAS